MLEPAHQYKDARVAQEVKKIHRSYHRLLLKAAELERIYRDIGIKFFLCPAEMRAAYFGIHFERAKRAFCQSFVGGETDLQQHMQMMRVTLDKVQVHLNLAWRWTWDEFETSDLIIGPSEAQEAFAFAKTGIANLVEAFDGIQDENSGRGVKIPIERALAIVGLERLPQHGGHPDRADFKAFALTVREIANLVDILVGPQATEDDGNEAVVEMRRTKVRHAHHEAVVSLRNEMLRHAHLALRTAEERRAHVGEEDVIIPSRKDGVLSMEDWAGEDEDADDGDSEADDESEATIPYEEEWDQVPVTVLHSIVGRPGAPEPAIQPR